MDQNQEQKNKPSKITQEEINLTEEELNRIFFGSDKTTTAEKDIQKNNNLSSKPKKLERQNKKLLTDITIPPDLTTLKKQLEEPKKPQGRPLVWTPERKEQLKRENALKAAQKRKEKSDKIRISKLSTQEPITKYETDKLVNSAIKSKEEIQKHFDEKRTILKDILAPHHNPFIRQLNICKEHLYKLHHFDTYGKVVIVCDHCSERKEMNIDEWNFYLAKNRKKL